MMNRSGEMVNVKEYRLKKSAGGSRIKEVVTSNDISEAVSDPPARLPGSLAVMVEEAPFGVLAASPQGRIVYANRSLGRMFGYEVDHLIGRPVEMLLPEQLRHRHVVVRREFSEDPQPRAMGAGRDLFGCHAAGHVFPIEVGLAAISVGGEQLSIAYVSSIVARRRLEQRFSSAVASLPIGLVMIDRDGMIVMSNPALEEQFGYAASELHGQRIEKLLPERIRENHPGMRSAFFASPEVRPMGAGRDLLARHKDGREFPVEIGLTPVETDDGRHVLAAVTDITLRKRAEDALLQTNAQLEEFSYAASHDLRSPLRGLTDLLTWINEDLEGIEVPAGVTQNLERAFTRVRRAESVIDDLLEYARAGTKDDRIVLVDPVELVDAALNLLAVPKDFKIEVDVPSKPFPAAKVPLSVAIRNLLGNAFEHHGGTTGVVRVEYREEGRYGVFTIEDDGQGVPRGADERIFRLFHRANTRNVGSGVGLAVTRRMVNANGGTVFLDRSGSLGGACFRIRWPRFPLKEIE